MRKKPVYAKDMDEQEFFWGSVTDGAFHAYVTLNEAWGPAGVKGRKVIAVFDGGDIAWMLENLPATGLSEADRAAVMRTAELLRRNEK